MKSVSLLCRTFISRRSCTNNINTSFHFFSFRFCSTQQQQQHHQRPSAVNIDDWTLNNEVVQRDLEIQEKWGMIGAELTASKEAKDYASIIDITSKGLAYFTEVGVEDAPLQCEPMLLMELSQAYYNMDKYAEALSSAERARAAIETGEGAKDMAKLAEVNEFIGFIYLRMRNIPKADEIFTALIRWIDVESKSAMPMVTVAARNMRRMAVMGEGLVLEAKAQGAQRNEGGGDATALFSAALDKLATCLDDHIQEGDITAVKDTLSGCLRCFVGLGDRTQARETCNKYISWCRRHGDGSGVAAGEAHLKSLE
eukprot:Tbor_TRINITY_DN5766_c1_g1::TRINITY_DN5766_c1_g1_i1::g.19727::m.19727